MMTDDGLLDQMTFLDGSSHRFCKQGCQALRLDQSCESLFGRFALDPHHDEIIIVSSSLGGNLEGECRPCACLLCPAPSHKEYVES